MLSILENQIYRVITGSHAYGTNRPDSDTDIRGICIPTLNHYFCMDEGKGVYLIKNEEDTQYYTIKKFFELASALNPNIIELLFIPDDCVQFEHPLMTEIKKHKLSFLSQKAVHTYTGYAVSQLKRLKAHYRWLSDPPSQPNREEYGAIEDDGKLIFFNGNKEHEYNTAHREYHNYLDWKTNRNPYRKELEDKYKFDVKLGAHGYRLMMQGKQILLEGTLDVRLKPDVLQTCKDILNGKWEYEKLVEFMEQSDIELREIAETKTVVPYSVDKEQLDALLLSTTKQWFNIS